MSTMFRRFVYGSTALATALVPIAAQANPLDGRVVAGAATINGTGTSSVTVDQSSAKAIIDWRSFNIAPGESTRFNQPDASSVTLNRVDGGLGASTINGIISANGGVYIVNPNGILFGPSSQVNVGSFLATTHDITNSDFMAGRNNFTISGSPTASIVNQGTITAADGGFAALVAPGVRNDGVISARLGEVALASGNAFTLDLYGDDLIKLGLSDTVAGDVVDVASGKALSSLVENTGTLKADGGKIALTAASARKVVDSVINTSGTVEADTVGTKGGLIVFGAQTASTKASGTPTQAVKVSGTVSAKGKASGTKGGKIQVTGEKITVANATLDASGEAGGGKILVGGDWKGGAADALAVTEYQQLFETTSVPTATEVSIDGSSLLNASAGTTGDGGKVVVWSDADTSFAGQINATGGATSGNGGFVETSGENLTIDGAKVDTSAPSGQRGHWLLDPANFTINTSTATTIENGLRDGNVIVSTVPESSDTSGDNGDITVNAPISWSTDNALVLDAYRALTVNANITSTGREGGLILYVNDGGTGGDFTVKSGSSVTLGGADAYLFINGIQYTLIHNASELEAIGPMNINSGVAYGHYALANDIALTQTYDANSGSFIGSGIFDGILDGLGHDISGLSIQASTIPYNNGWSILQVGLFGFLSTSSIVENLNIIDGRMYISSSHAIDAGFLAGGSYGTVYNVSTSGSIIADYLGGTAYWTTIGGLLGGSLGDVISSSSSVFIEANHVETGAYIGGLIGLNTGNIYTSVSNSRILASGDLSIDGAFTGIGGLVGLNYSFTDGDGVFSSSSSGNITYIDNYFPQRYVTYIGYVYDYNSDFSDRTLYLGGLIGKNNFYSSVYESNTNVTVVSGGCGHCTVSGAVTLVDPLSHPAAPTVSLPNDIDALFTLVGKTITLTSTTENEGTGDSGSGNEVNDINRNDENLVHNEIYYNSPPTDGYSNNFTHDTNSNANIHPIDNFSPDGKSTQLILDDVSLQIQSIYTDIISTMITDSTVNKFELASADQQRIASVLRELYEVYQSYKDRGWDGAQLQSIFAIATTVEEIWLEMELEKSKVASLGAFGRFVARSLPALVVGGQKLLGVVIIGTGQLLANELKAGR